MRDQQFPPPYKISPSDLVYLFNNCKRCFYDKVRNRFRPPRSFSEHFTNADRAMREALVRDEIIDLGVGPCFRVVAQGEWIESEPIRFDAVGISISFAGKYDAVVVTENEEVFVIDYKTTTLDDFALAKFYPQLMAYVTAIELPRSQTTMLPAYVDGIALLVFDPVKFAFNPKTKNSGLYGPTRWVELPRDQKRFDDLMQAVAQLVAHPQPPRSDRNCDICKLRLQVDQEDGVATAIVT